MEIYDVCKVCGDLSVNKVLQARTRVCPKCGIKRAEHIQTTDEAEANRLHNLLHLRTRYWLRVEVKRKAAEAKRVQKAAERAARKKARTH
jgi:hypothetical protein